MVLWLILRSLRARVRGGKGPEGEKGQALVEAALITPILLMIVLGVIESGNALSVKHKMAVLSREGANLASRGTPMAEAIDVIMANGDEIGLSDRGGAIVSRIVMTGGLPIIETQVAWPGYAGESRLGLPDSTAAALATVGLEEGQVLHAVEILLFYEPLTPVAALLPGEVAQRAYERAIF